MRDCFSIYKNGDMYPRTMLPQTLDDPPLFIFSFTLGECTSGFVTGMAFMMFHQGSLLTLLAVPVGLCVLFALKKYRELIIPGILIHIAWSLGFNLTHKDSPLSGWFYCERRTRRYVP